jgi:elongation factor Ts
MAEITAQLVKQLRDKTNAGMMDCQKALKETAGDLEAAVEWLRKKGISRADAKSTRAAKEGLIHAVVDGKVAAMIEMNCETDFVAKNDNFRAFVNGITQSVASAASANDGSVEGFSNTTSPDGKGTVGEAIKAKIGEIGENLILRRLRRFQAGADSVVKDYIHMAGRVGVLVEVAAGKAETLTAPEFQVLVKDLTLQIAASAPEFLKRSEVPEALKSKEEEIQRERMASQLTNKPANIQQKIVEGSMGKFYALVCLLEQGFIKDPDKTVEELISATGKQLGDTITVKRFARFAVGEELKA